MTLSGKTAVVTGGAGVLGSAVVRELLAAGARVAVPVRRPGDVERLRDRARLDPETPLSGAVVDLTDERAVLDFCARVAEDRGGLDILVNAAGGFAGGSARPRNALVRLAGTARRESEDGRSRLAGCRSAAAAARRRRDRECFEPARRPGGPGSGGLRRGQTGPPRRKATPTAWLRAKLTAKLLAALPLSFVYAACALLGERKGTIAMHPVTVAIGSALAAFGLEPQPCKASKTVS